MRQSSSSDYEAIVITAENTFEILQLMPQLERTLTLLIAATGLRISECLGLQWGDVDWEKQKIYVRRAWTRGKIGRPKSKASKAPVPLHALLATFLREWKSNTLYCKPDDWVFASERLRWQATACSQHAGGGSLASGSGKGWGSGTTERSEGTVRLPQPEAFARLVSGG